MPFFHNGLKTDTGIRVFSDFYMEMSRGVSLLRTTQSLLTGRTILEVEMCYEICMFTPCIYANHLLGRGRYNIVITCCFMQ